MRKSSLRNRRHRNPQIQEGERQQPFFSKSNAGVVQKKEDHHPFFQAKLSIGQPGDKYEQEADAVANQVVNAQASSSQVQLKEISSIRRSKLTENQEEEPIQTQKEEEEPVQMMPSSEKEEKEVQMQVEEEEEPIQMKEGKEEEELQMKAEAGHKTATPQLGSRIQSKTGKGKPIPKKHRSQMENAFGTDFGGVNIHTDTESVRMNKELGAQAFTHGKDVFFNAGKYRPESSDGKKLLAHELTHVVQQQHFSKNDKATKIQRAVSTFCNPPSHWGMPPATWIPLGEFAHFLGRGDYLSKMGGARGVDLYMDTFELTPIDPLYAAFIIRNNPSIATWKKVFLSVTPMKRPDYMIHRGITEFDELKPDSIPSVASGVAKIYEIKAIMDGLGLPYSFGITYKPTRIIPLIKSSFKGVPFEVSLKFERKRSGLITYEYCITTDWNLVAKAALIAVVAALLLLLLKKLPVPGPVPVPA